MILNHPLTDKPVPPVDGPEFWDDVKARWEEINSFSSAIATRDLEPVLPALLRKFGVGEGKTGTSASLLGEVNQSVRELKGVVKKSGETDQAGLDFLAAKLDICAVKRKQHFEGLKSHLQTKTSKSKSAIKRGPTNAANKSPPKPSKSGTKILEADKHLMQEKVDLQMELHGTYASLLEVELKREVAALEPLAALLSSYVGVIQKGMKQLDSLLALQKVLGEATMEGKAQLLQLSKENSVRRNSFEAKLKEQYEHSGSGAGELIPRDLAGPSASAGSDATTRQGLLYFPHPTFQAAWCSIADGTLTVQEAPRPSCFSPDLPKNNNSNNISNVTQTLSFPLLLCTVKCEPSVRYRFVFAVMSPTAKVHTCACSG